MTTLVECVAIEAPSQLVADTRVEFRDAAFSALERAGGCAVLRVEMRRTEVMDASGLGALVMVHRRAQVAGLRTQLANPQVGVRALLAATKLAALFEVV